MIPLELDSISNCLQVFSEDELKYLQNKIEILPKGNLVLNLVDWAARDRYLPSEITPKPGLFDWSLVPYLIEPAKCLSFDSPIRHVVICKGVQIGATTALIENFIGYIIKDYPASILYAQAEKDLAALTMELKVDKMLSLLGVKDKIFSQHDYNNKKSGGDKALYKEFPGGFLYAIGARNPRKMRSVPCRVILRDEIDAWGDIKNEGDPLEITAARATAYEHNKKILDITTPTTVQAGRIMPLLESTDYKIFYVPCPHCGEFQNLVWNDKENDTGFRYDYDDKYVLIPDTVYYKCKFCGGKIREYHKHTIFNQGVYRATRSTTNPYMTGFHIPGYYSLFKSWDECVRQFIEAQKDKKKLPTFQNLVLAVSFQEVEINPKPDHIQRNQRDYRPASVPNKMAIADGNGPIVILTCAVDVHVKKNFSSGRLDVEILGHCENGSTYSILWKRLKGDAMPYWAKAKSPAYQHDSETLRENIWYQLYELMQSRFISDDGKSYTIKQGVIDSAYEPNLIFGFINNVFDDNGRLIPILGVGSKNKITLAGIRETKNVKGRYFEVHGNTYKDDIAGRMGLKWGGHPHHQPSGFMNYPTGGEYDKNYFDEYGGEYKVAQYDSLTARYKGSVWIRKYTGAPNHAWDCRVYNHAALDIFVYRLCKAANVQGLDYSQVFTALKGKMGLQ